MSKFSTIIKWTHKKNAEQNENLNQCASLYHDIHLKSHASNSMSHIQCNDQINLDAQSCNLTHKFRCEQIRNDMSELQEWADQEIS